MMQPMNKKLNKVMKETTEKEKITLFYELGKFFLDTDEIDEELEDLFAEIANVVNAIENL